MSFFTSADFWAGWGIVVLGTLAHFLYEWSGHKTVFAFFCAVNESTWEHIKLAFGPGFLWMLFQLTFCAQMPNFAPAKLGALLVSCTVMPLFFYACKAILKKDVLALDIADFVLSVFAGQYCSYRLLNCPPFAPWAVFASIILLTVLYTGYMIHTVVPVKRRIAQDPITGEYGIKAHFALDRLKRNKKQG